MEKGSLVVMVVKCIDLPSSMIDTPDAYVKLRLSKGNKHEEKTKRVDDCLDPVFNYKCVFPLEYG
jgi:hypothetical protein